MPFSTTSRSKVCTGLPSPHHFLSLSQLTGFYHCPPGLGSCCHLSFPPSLVFSYFSSRIFTSSHQRWTPFISDFFSKSTFYFLCIMPALGSLGCYSKSPYTQWFYKQQKPISHNSGSLKSKTTASARSDHSESPLLEAAFCLCPDAGGRQWEHSLGSLVLGH